MVISVSMEHLSFVDIFRDRDTYIEIFIPAFLTFVFNCHHKQNIIVLHFTEHQINSIDFLADSSDKILIQQAINEFHKYTCIRIQPVTGKESDFVAIESRANDARTLGRTGGPRARRGRGGNRESP